MILFSVVIFQIHLRRIVCKMNILTLNVKESSLQNNLESEIILMWNFKVVDQFLNPHQSEYLSTRF